jgi:hypothetical protein
LAPTPGSQLNSSRNWNSAFRSNPSSIAIDTTKAALAATSAVSRAVCCETRGRKKITKARPAAGR